MSKEKRRSDPSTRRPEPQGQDEMQRMLSRRRRSAILVLLLLFAGVGGAAGAAYFHLFDPDEALGGLLGWGAVLAVGLAISLGWSIDHIPWLRTKQRDPRLADIRNWQALKVVSILLNLLLLLTLVFLIFTILGRAGLLPYPEDAGLARIGSILAVALAGIAAMTYFQAMRNDLELDRTMAIALAHVVTLLMAFGAASFAVVGNLTPGTQSLVFLVAWSLVALDLFLTRSIPNLYTLAADKRKAYHGAAYLSKSKAVVYPIMVAFALLVVMFLVILAAGPGAERAAEAAQASPLVAGIVGGVLLAGIATVVVARRLARQEDRPELYQQGASVEEARGRLLLMISLGLGTMGAIAAGLVFAGQGGIVSKSWWVDIFAAAILMGMGPYGFYAVHENRRIRALEDRFPDFLRDIASSHRGGLTLSASVTVAARGDYGALTPYVQRMSDQMTWNVPFGQSLTWMADQVRTRLVRRAVYLILEADRSGGGTADVLYAASRDARELKKMEVDRRIAMSLYAIVIHITFGVFLLVAAIMFQQFVPQIVAAAQATAGTGSQLPGNFGPSSADTEVADYRAFYYLAALVQGVGSGLVAGIMSTGRAVLGLSHAFIMVSLSFLTFTVLLL